MELDLKLSKKIVKDAIIKATKGKHQINDETSLIGSSILDSVDLVEVCLLLEDESDKFGFQFDWTSDSTLSKSQSIFRSVSSLAEEFLTQSGN